MEVTYKHLTSWTIKWADLSIWFNLGKEKMHFWVICKAQYICFPCLYCRASGRWWLQGAWGLSWKLAPCPAFHSDKRKARETSALYMVQGCKTAASQAFPVFDFSFVISSAMGTISIQLLFLPPQTSSSRLSKKQREVPISCPINACASSNITWKETQMGERRFGEDPVGGKEN